MITKNKKIKLYSLSVMLMSVLFAGVFMQSCGNDDVFVETPNEKSNFPSSADNYGKSVANEVRNTVKNLNKMGIDYSNANNSIEFKERFYENLYKASPITVNNQDMINNISQMDPAVFAEKIRNLTDIQLAFIQRIIKECDDSKSYEDLSKRLIDVNKDIYSEVPKIQQERLFNITAVLYYGIKEIQNLEKQGQMLRTPNNDIQRVRLKSGDEVGSIGGSCSKFLATVWTIAVGEPTPAGEIVAAVITVIVAGVYLYEVTVCNSNNSYNPNYAYCLGRFLTCFSIIYDGCGMCMHFCLLQGYWPPYSTHKCT
jgi:hypothetical protein